MLIYLFMDMDMDRDKLIKKRGLLRLKLSCHACFEIDREKPSLSFISTFSPGAWTLNPSYSLKAVPPRITPKACSPPETGQQLTFRV